MYNVARFLPDFFTSLETQTYGFERLEVILIDDGSRDETAELAAAFADKHANVTLLRKQNGGQASARNAGLPLATGTWLTFPDPDDTLSENYFSIVASAIDHDRPQAMLSTRLLLWHEAEGDVRDTHALGGRFREGTVTRNLMDSPSWIQAHVTSGFVQRSVVTAAGLLFPEELRLRFEDGAFVSRYLLCFPEPRVTFLPDAQYLYRQRSDSSSTIQQSSAKPEKYTDTIRFGYLPVMQEAQRTHSSVPRWLQNLILYDQFWIFGSSQTPAVRNARFSQDTFDQLDELLPRLLQFIDDEAIEDFDVMYAAPWMREALILTKRGKGTAPVYWGAKDARRRLRSIIYRFKGPAPSVTLRINGKDTGPLFEKKLGLEYVGRPIVMQHTLWVPDDALVELEIDGKLEPIHDRPPRFISAFRGVATKSRARHLKERVRDAIARRIRPGGLHYWRRDAAIRSRKLADRFENAWVFIDRDVDAGDSAEDQYWWMRTHHPEMNSWFVVRKGTRDWRRMTDAGARLVGYGTPEFYALLKHADHLASSHADRFITHVLPSKMNPRGYAFTFLQHGVIKGDISHWLNPKDIQTFIASTQAEYSYLTESPAYRYSAKEVALAGLPRFDVLKERADAVPPEERNLILVMPTWRDYLVGRMGKDSADREMIRGFTETVYAKSLSGLLNDHRLLSLSERLGKRIIFMPHPNMQPYLSEFALPQQVEVRSYADTDVRDMLIRASVLVTDYSSIAFNAAYIRAPVLYFQFDLDEYLSGHTERAGYFEYETDGFGPVVSTIDDASESVMSIVANGIDNSYLRRMELAFPERDGQNRRRVYEAMLRGRTVA